MNAVKRDVVSLLLVVALLVVAAPAAVAGIPAPAAPAEPDPAPASLPEGVPDDWWASVQDEIRRSEYEVTWQDATSLADVPAAYQAPNRAHNLRTYFTTVGPVVLPRTSAGAWRLDLRLVAWGWDGAEQAPGVASLNASGNRIEYGYGDLTGFPNLSGLVEWYVNDERGLEQGFTLPLPPGAGPAAEKVVVEVAFETDLAARLAADGAAVEFADASGSALLRYGQVQAVDAAGRTLAAHLSLSDSQVSLWVDTSGAQFPITIDPLITGLSTTANWTAEGNRQAANFGFSVGAAGDVNGDGYADVIVGARGYDTAGQDTGRAYVYFGSAAGLSGSESWKADGDQAQAMFGYSVGTAGDVNGDGFADVIVGAHLYDNDQTDEGRAYVYYGSPAGLNTSFDWMAESNQVGACFGTSVGTAGDVNGDGYADVIVGAPYYDTTLFEVGRVYVYYGSASSGLSGPWTAEGDQANALFGYSVGTAGDVNGDGYADVIVGARYYDTAASDEGRVYVYYSEGSGFSATPWMADGDQYGASFGASVGTAGDVNGDGYADVIVGAPGYDNGETNEGRAYVYYSEGSGFSATPWMAESDRAGASFGASVGTAGDVNGDGYADVIIGAPDYSNGEPYEGAAYVYHGSGSGLIATANWTVESNEVYVDFGYSVGTAGDVNGDGYADVIVGALYYSNPEDSEGRAYVYHGAAAGLSATANWTAVSDQAGAQFGFSVGTAGDVNGDGYADVIVGALYYDAGLTDEGRAYVYHGSGSGLNASFDWTADGDQTEAYFGSSVGTAGDVNGDGYADVIVGAAGYTNGQTYEGRAYVYHGAESGLSLDPDWMAESDWGDASFGSSVGTAGDVNGDGYADVIVGAPGYTNGQTYEGRAYVYHGGPAGLNPDAGWMAESDQEYASFGWSVGTAGDVNGDGYAAVIVGAPYYDNGETNEGRAYVYYSEGSGFSATPWMAESDQANALFGWSVGTAGDVNGDGYADVVVGAYPYSNGEALEGAAFAYYGSVFGLGANGTPANADWMAESNHAWDYFGWSVGTAGDVNGDGYADVIVGAPDYSNGQDYEGRASVYYGNASDGLEVTPQQRRADDSAPVAPGGQSISPTEARLAALARTPFGRSQVRLEWEVKEEGVAFDGTGLGQSDWQDSGTAGYAFDELVSSLSFERRYHWRVRIAGRPANAATSHVVTYRSRWLYGSAFFTALSGEQSIAGTGQTNLLEQSAYVDVGTQGTLTGLTLRGYPQTAHPYENYHGLGALALDRYFTITPNGGASGYNLTLCLNYDDAELDSLVEADLMLCRWTGTVYACLARSTASDTSLNLVCADNVTQLSDWVVATGSPTVVELVRFEAWEEGPRSIRVEWETSQELDNLGYHLYRSKARNGVKVQLDKTLIPTAVPPGSLFGAIYGWSDGRGLRSGETYFYWLEVVDIYGQTTLHGPVRVKMQ